LVALETRSVEPLIAALDAKDPVLVAQAAQTLGRLGDRSAVLPLLAPALANDSPREVRGAASTALSDLIGEVPSSRAAQILLSREAENHLNRRMRLRENVAGEASIWTWDAAKKRPVPITRAPDDAQAHVAARLARDLYRIAPSIENRRLFLLANLENVKLTEGLDTVPPAKDSIRAEAAAMGPSVIDDVLAQALLRNHVAAAIAAAEILGSIADATLLHRSDGRSATLVDATRHADRRVRYAATAAIMRLKPISPYAGSSAVAEAAADLVTGAGRPRAMVAAPRADHAQSLAALLGANGFDATIAVSGREAVLLATRSADYELLLVDAAIGEPEILWVHDALRRDRRTATLPIGLLADRAAWDYAQHLAQRDRLTLVFPQAQDERTMENQVRRLLERAKPTAVPPEVRLAYAEAALGWMAATADNPHGLYDWRRHEAAIRDSLGVARLSSRASDVLARLGTHSSQQSLVELAGQHARPLAVRQAAALAFSQSVPRFGVQLTTAEIADQYARYNRSRDLDPQTQRVLGAVLDAIERKSAAEPPSAK
jgi:CheY-like chemotaxis protein